MLKQHINTNAADLSHVDSISAAFSTPSFLIFRTVSLIYLPKRVIVCTTERETEPKTTKERGKHYVARRHDSGTDQGRQDGGSLLDKGLRRGQPVRHQRGRISKLTLKENGKVIYNYDRGEDVPEQNEAAEIALAILMYEYK